MRLVPSPGGSPILGKADRHKNCVRSCAIPPTGVSDLLRTIPHPATCAAGTSDPSFSTQYYREESIDKSNLPYRQQAGPPGRRNAPCSLNQSPRQTDVFIISLHLHDFSHVEKAGSASLNGPGEIFLGSPRSRPVLRVPSGILTARRDKYAQTVEARSADPAGPQTRSEEA